ncbi:hypothetical protein [Absidia glauca]|uniref:RNA-binding protein vts1-like alpha-helical domain-containing protein n=1 Tax=Absidia glauca TaxID=4829 RepID=A0A163KLU7_ABSGL|nr:hypothetical protein [Absidia glauca]
MLPSNFNTRNSRPVSEILKPGNHTSSENDSLNLWYDDLQQYERNLDEMAAASLDQNFKEEMHHVDQWFRFLSEAERTATIYTLLQHSSQVQIRFFINLLQQMGKRDSMHSILMTPTPDHVDMQSQFAGALAKAEMEASQRLMSVLPYKTGQVVSRPLSSTTRRQVDRHSFALGDTEDYSRQFVGNTTTPPSRLAGGGRPTSQNFGGGGGGANTLLTPGASPFHSTNGSSNRPRSVIEGDTSTLFSTPWSTPTTSAGPASSSTSRRPMSVVGNIGDRNGAGGLERPKSADVSNWSFTAGMDPMLTMDQQQQQQRTTGGNTTAFPSSSPWTLGLDSDIDFSTLTLQPYRRGNSGVRGTGVMRNSIPGTLSETDEQQPQPPLKTPTISRPTSPRPASSSSTPFNHRKHLVPPGMEKQFGQFLNPSEHPGGASLDDHDHHSDHSDPSSHLSNRRVSNTTIHRGSTLVSTTTPPKDKKPSEGLDLELLQDVPAWFRSLRLHKYNAIFEPMKWQDINIHY